MTYPGSEWYDEIEWTIYTTGPSEQSANDEKD
jgi:hypothetical protein